MLLTGTHPRTLDDKKRLVLPKRVREQLGQPETLFVTPGPDQSLWLYTQAGLEQLAARLDQAPATPGAGPPARGPCSPAPLTPPERRRRCGTPPAGPWSGEAGAVRRLAARGGPDRCPRSPGVVGRPALAELLGSARPSLRRGCG